MPMFFQGRRRTAPNVLLFSSICLASRQHFVRGYPLITSVDISGRGGAGATSAVHVEGNELSDPPHYASAPAGFTVFVKPRFEKRDPSFGGQRHVLLAACLLTAGIFSRVRRTRTSAATMAAPAQAGFAAFARGIRDLQDTMKRRAEAADPSARWTVDEHPRGRACIIEDGELWEKGCISVALRWQ